MWWIQSPWQRRPESESCLVLSLSIHMQRLWISIWNILYKHHNIMYQILISSPQMLKLKSCIWEAFNLHLGVHLIKPMLSENVSNSCYKGKSEWANNWNVQAAGDNTVWKLNVFGRHKLLIANSAKFRDKRFAKKNFFFFCKHWGRC